jgi:VCBS repeat-containing protein/CshA-type fibril repeat protein
VPGNVNNATAGSSGGLFTIGSTGTLSFSDNGDFNDLAVGQTRDTTITYQITDSDGGTATATVTVTVTGANDVPVLVTPFADPASVTDGNTGFTFATAASFNDPDTADVLTYALGSGAPAWLTINATTGVVSVVGAIPANASQGSNVVGGPLGAYDIQVIASDGNGGTVNDTFRLTVTNPPPVAVDDAGAAGEDSATVSGNVLTGPGNDHDTAPDSDPLTISEVNGSGALIDAAVTGSAGGSFTVSAAGVWTFNPGLDFQYLAVGQTATTSVSYTVSDGNGGTDTATLTMTVTGSNDGPVPAGTIATQSGTDGAPITPLSVLGNFQDPDINDTLTFSVPSGLVPPGLVFNPVTATFSGTAAANASQGSTPGQPAGTYVVPVTVDDGHGGTLTQNVTFTFGNLAPTATNDTATISEDGASIGGNALLNDHDTAPDSDPLHVSAINGQPGLVGQPVAGSAGGTFTLDGNGQWTFAPGLDFQNLNAGDTRVTTLSYQVADGQGGTATATVSVTVTGSNDAPVPLGPIGPQSGVDGQAIAPIAAGASFDNPTALPLTFSATGLPPGLMIDPVTGVITGTLQNDASVAGPYVINVTASAPGGVSATVPVVLNVSNPVPVAQDDGVATAINSPVSISPLANDADPDGDALTVSVATAPAYGTVVANPDGTFTYTPSSGYTGSDSFTYQVSDGQGGFDTATVTIAVGVPNPDGPTGTAMAPASGTDGSAITPIGTAASFSDPTGDPLSFSAAGLPPGLAIDPATGVITGTLPNDASLGGPYTAQVTATDPAGNQVTLPLVIVVVNPAPVAADDAVAVPLNDATTLNPLGNDSDPDGDALQVTYTSSPAHGTVVIHGDGTLTYTPDTGYTGPDSFTYTVSDGQGGTDTATVMLSVGAPLPGAPTAGPVPGQSGVDGAAVSIPVATLATVIDPDGDPLTYTAVGLPPGLSINPATGVITGTLPHDASQGGPYTVQVFASDPSGNSVGIPFLLSVTNPTPTAVNDVIETPEGAPVTIAVLANDTAPDHDPLTVTSVTPPAHGSVVINADGSITYTPATGFSGSDTFSYTISDGNGGTSSATVSVDVGPVTTLAPPPAVAPVGVNDGETITPVSVLSGFGDPDNASGLVLSVDGAALPPGLSFNPTTGEFTGTLTLDASQGATPGEPTGTYIVPVTATDSHGATVTQLVTFVVGNIAPVAAADTGSIGEDAATVGGNALLNDHDTAPDADALHVSAVNGVPGNVGAAIAGSAGGTFTLAANGTWHFEPGLDFQNLNTGDTRQTSITYTVADGQGGTSTATVTVTVSGSNDPPVALGPIPVQHGTDGAAITPIDAGGAFDNPAALPLTFSATGLPPGLSIDPSMGIIGGTLQNNASIAGPYIITVTATGPDGETASLPVQLEVANPPPVAQGDGAATAGDTPVIIAALANDSDPDGDVLLVSAVGTAGHGTVVINPNGTVTYTPDSGFTGTDSFTYTASDGQGGTSTATITVSVGAPSPTVPTGTPIPDAAGQDGSAITPIPVAGHFSDPNGDPLTFTATGLPPGLTINPVTGVITGTLPADASVGGPYTVMVTGTDPSDNQVTEPLVIAIANPAPVALDDAVLTPSDVPVTLNPLGNDSDPDGDPLQVSHVAQPAHGTVTINPDGSLTYTPDAGYVGPDSFTYTVSDGQGGTDIATVTLGVGEEDPNAPVADPVSPQSGTDGAPVSIDVADLSNAFDPDGGPLSYSATGLPPGLSINPTTGVISGTLPHDASAGGPYAVTVFATDPDGKQVAIPFTLAVANPPPVAAADTVETAPDTPVTIAVLANDHDPDHDPLTITSTTGPAHGTLSINPDGSITFNPTPGYVGPDSFTYTVSDGNGGQSTATVTIDVGPVDTLGPPQAVDPVNTTDGAVLPPLDVTGAFGDPDTVSGLTFSVDPSTLPPGITFNPATGTFSGTAANTASQGATPGEPAGTYIVPVTASDGAGGQTTVLVTFSFANLPPVASDDQSTSTEDAGQGGNVLTDPVTGDHDTAPDSDPLAVTLVNGHAVTPGLPATLSLPHGTLIMSSTGAWTFTPNGAANALAVGETATETVTYTVSDGNGGTDTATLEIEITGVNDAPVGVGSIPDHRNFEGVGVNVDVAGFFDDPDTSDVLSFSASGLPPGLTIDPHTGVISGTIALGAAAGGPYDVTVTVSDGHGGTVSLDFEWAVDMMAAPPAPPAPGPLPLPPLPGVGPGGETDHVISDMVDGMGGLGSGLLPADHIIVRTVESLGSLNSAGHLGDETQVIARLAAWAERQGRDARWMADLLDALDQHPYAGDAAPLSLNQDGQALLAVRTLLEDGALFIGIDGLKAGARVLGVTGAGGAALPDEIAVVDPQTLVVNVRAGARRYVIEVTGQGPGGGIFTWPLVVDPQNGRIALSVDGGQQIGRLIDAMRNQIAKASPAAGPPPGFMIAAQ